MRNAEEIGRLWKDITARNLNPDEKQIAEAVFKTRSEYVKEGIFPAPDALLAGDYGRAEKLFLTQVDPLYKKAEGDSDKLMQMVLDNAKKGFEAESARYGMTRNLTIGAILAGLILAALATLLLVRSITRPLNKAIGFFNRIAEGDLNSDIEIGGRDEVGQVLSSLAVTQVHLRVIVDQIRLATNSINANGPPSA